MSTKVPNVARQRKLEEIVAAHNAAAEQKIAAMPHVRLRRILVELTDLLPVEDVELRRRILDAAHACVQAIAVAGTESGH